MSDVPAAPTRADLKLMVQDPNMRAFLQVIRGGEGTLGPFGYQKMFGGSIFGSFQDHPRILNTCKTPHGPLSSTAAGAYQFLARTWDGLVQQYGFEDFSPENQDEGAVALIAGRDALGDVIGGNFDAAVRKCSPEWASLPYSRYGQPTKTLAQALEVYTSNGGQIRQG